MKVRRERAGRVARFNRILSILLQEMCDRDPADDTLDRVRNRIGVAVRELPTILIETAGPYLYEHRAVIMSNDPAQLATLAQKSTKSVDEAEPSEKTELAGYVLRRVVGWWEICSPDEFRVYYPAMQELTRLYLECLVIDKTGKPLPKRDPPVLAIFDPKMRVRVRSVPSPV